MSRVLFCALLLPALAAAQDHVSVPPHLLQRVEPRYPEAALQAGVAGKVLLQLTINSAGAVTGVRVLQVEPASQGFDDAALRAAKLLRFEPATRDGAKISAEVGYEVTFHPPSVAGGASSIDQVDISTRYNEEIEVQGHYLNRVGTTDAASAGSYTHQLIEDRPLLRPGEIEELVPGLIITQHSGAGKANQFLLRGFNLDHGTDFATTLDGIPVNLPAHAHGQGYDDLNFIIPELIGHVDYFKGPYYAAKGDFASAGAADLFYVDSLLQNRLEVIGGSYGYYRTLAAASPELAGGTLLVALEAAHQDGPWVVPENYSKYNSVIRYMRPIGEGLLSLMAQGYSGEWNATDQIALRSVTSKTLSRFGGEDPSDGGKSHRFTFSANWDQELGGGRLHATAFASKYDLDLFSNFTYFLDDPVNGDQMEQQEHRWYEGFNGVWQKNLSLFGLPQRVELGWDGRIDHVDPLGLYHTVGRVRLNIWSLDAVTQSSGALYGTIDTHFASRLRLSLGLRATAYDFQVNSADTRNSGSETDGLLLPKVSLIFGPWAKTELFLNFGEDYHSNDARGVTATIDAKSGDSIPKVSALPKSLGYEAGLRTEILPKVQASIAFWVLDLDSELVWDADAGTTVPSARTRREGVEFSTRYQPIRWLLFDLDAAFSRARFRDFDPAGQSVPEGIESAISAGASIHNLGPWSASLFMRYFGPRALTQDDSVRSGDSLLLNSQASYNVTKNLRFSVDVFNIFDAEPDDIAYYYASRLKGEAALTTDQCKPILAKGLPCQAGVNDIHFHPTEPRSLRVAMVLSL
jgi:TonB family protein